MVLRQFMLKVLLLKNKKNKKNNTEYLTDRNKCHIFVKQIRKSPEKFFENLDYPFRSKK